VTIDDNLVERMLDGSVELDDLPSELVAVASVLRAAAAPPRPDEQHPAPGAIREIFEQARRPPAIPSSGRRERPAARRWTVRAAVAAVIAGVTISGGAALAATGNLPGPVQSAAHDLLGVVGVDVPDAPAGGSEPDSPDPTGGQAPTTDVATTPAPTTVVTGGPSTDPTPTTDVIGVPGRGDEQCQESSDGRCQAGEHGRAGDEHPSVTRPSVTEPVPPTTVDPSPPENPSVTRPENPSVTRPENPSETAPGQTKEKDKDET